MYVLVKLLPTLLSSLSALVNCVYRCHWILLLYHSADAGPSPTYSPNPSAHDTFILPSYSLRLWLQTRHLAFAHTSQVTPCALTYASPALITCPSSSLALSPSLHCQFSVPLLCTTTQSLRWHPSYSRLCPDPGWPLAGKEGHLH